MAPAHTGIVSHSVSRLKQPALFGFLLAALITLPLAESVFQVPIQVSDSLEAIGIAAKYSSASQLLSAQSAVFDHDAPSHAGPPGALAGSNAARRMK